MLDKLREDYRAILFPPQVGVTNHAEGSVQCALEGPAGSSADASEAGGDPYVRGEGSAASSDAAPAVRPSASDSSLSPYFHECSEEETP